LRIRRAALSKPALARELSARHRFDWQIGQGFKIGKRRANLLREAASHIAVH
jgi:hypothetical protein